MSDIINFFIKGYAEGLIDAPTIQLIFGRAGDVPVHRDSEVQGLYSDERPAPGQLEQGGVEHGHADTGLVRVVDLKRFANRHADPPIFEYAVFQEQTWSEVRNVKTLLGHVSRELWSRDAERFRSTPDGSSMVTAQSMKKPHVHYLRLDEKTLLYSHWATQYLLRATQDFIRAFDLDDEVFVKML